MSSREEKLEQIETALTNRVFDMVPEVHDENSISWSAEDHRINRLSRALAAYALVGLCKLSDESAVSAITDGRNDGGIDALHFHRTENKLLVVQAKYKRTGAGPDQAEMIKSCGGVKALCNRRFMEFNSHFTDRADMIEEALDAPGATIELVIVYLGETVGEHATNEANHLVRESVGTFTWKAYGFKDVHAWLVNEETPITVDADFPLQNWAKMDYPFRAIYGSISARELAAIVEEKGPDLFERNIRKYMGEQTVNNLIQKTVRESPGHLFYLNNGLTAIARRIVQSPGGTDRRVFRLEGVSIVNGAQTAGAIAVASFDGEISEDARLLITIIEIGDDRDELGKKITKARNHQNLVRVTDFAALDSNQERLRRECATIGYTYHYRHNDESRISRDDAFTFEEAAIAMACLTRPLMTRAEVDAKPADEQKGLGHAVEFVVVAKKEIGRLWDQYDRYYRKLFTKTTSPINMCRCVRIYRLIDCILASNEAASSNPQRKSFFRHCRYFVMIFVARQAATILGRIDVKITDEDRTALSRSTLEMAELIYAKAATYEGSKGYSAVFKNLTDSQQLADQIVNEIRSRTAMQEGTGPHENTQGAT